MRKTENTTDNWVQKHVNSTELFMLLKVYEGLFVDLLISQATIRYFQKLVDARGLPALTDFLPAFCKHFEACLEQKIWSPFVGVKDRNGPYLFHEEISHIFRNIECPTELCAQYVRGIRQICYFAYKAQPVLAIQPIEVATAMVKYLDLERSLPQEIEWDPVLVLANLSCQSVFTDFEWDGLRSSHGPGTVADLEFARKYDSPLNGNHCSEVRNQVYGGHDHMTSFTNEPSPASHKDYFRRGHTSEFLCVPKDSRGPRTICREPSLNQYAQQGIRRYMESKMESHPLTKGRINFKDQTINGRLALYHSVTKEYSTIDLSDASDRVTLALFDKVFCGTAVGSAILDCRSSHVAFPNGYELRLRKMSPMGSAVCFTILSFTVWALLAASFVLVGRSDLADGIHVYGDDIIVPSEAHGQAIAILESYSLQVNAGKSFVHSHFRESCGVDAYNGVNVTPVRLRYHLTNDRLGAGRNSQLPSYVATIWQLWSAGYFAAAEVLSTLISEEGVLIPPGTDSDSHLSLPEDLLGISKRRYFVETLGLVPKLDSVGRPYVRSPLYRVESKRTKVDESDFSFFYRVLLPGIRNINPLTGEDNPTPYSASYGSVVVPRTGSVRRRNRRVYLDN